MESTAKNKVFILLIVSYSLMLVSLIMYRNSLIMILALGIRLIVTVFLMRSIKDKLLVVAFWFQVLSFVVVFGSGVLLEVQSIDLYEAVFLQSNSIQTGYILMGAADALIIYKSSRFTQNFILEKIYRILAMMIVVFEIIGIVGFLYPIPMFFGVLMSVMEFTTFGGYVGALIFDFKEQHIQQKITK